MDAAAEAKAIRPDSRVDFLANHLVVVAPKDAAPDAFDLTPAAFEASLAGSKLATGEIKTAPAGDMPRNR